MAFRCKCGAWWTGLKVEHCTVCHQSFTGTNSGDKHRVAVNFKLDENGRKVRLSDRNRCLSEDEMREAGMSKNHFGLWSLGGGNWRREETDE